MDPEGPSNEPEPISDKDFHLKGIKAMSQKRDVTYDLYRYFQGEMKSGDEHLLNIQKQGYYSEAREWLLSLSPEEMKYGTANREQRLAEAKRFADLAGTTVEQIAEENNLSDLL